ncbi:MAG TPA: glucose 1-dehydrogenase [Roseiflexaceae bacterium]|nr:glucose 1-dehydrogenase [Roseiflexaceae bacterium]
MTRLAGRVALVTGAGRGIGRGIALGYAREGADLVLVSRTAQELDAVADEARLAGVEVLVRTADVRDDAAVRAVVEAAVREFGRIDVLVNAAGIPMVSPTVELPLESWRRVIDVNLTGTFLFCQAAGRIMIEQGRGSIINIGSIHSFQGIPQRAAYAASKGGVLQFTRSLAVEWAPLGVRVNMIAPGWIRTPLQDELVAQGKLDRTPIIARTPARRIGEVADIVGPAIFLASDEAAFIVGEMLVVDGGWGVYGFL